MKTTSGLFSIKEWTPKNPEEFWYREARARTGLKAAALPDAAAILRKSLRFNKIFISFSAKNPAIFYEFTSAYIIIFFNVTDNSLFS